MCAVLTGRPPGGTKSVPTPSSKAEKTSSTGEKGEKTSESIQCHHPAQAMQDNCDKRCQDEAEHMV